MNLDSKISYQTWSQSSCSMTKLSSLLLKRKGKERLSLMMMNQRRAIHFCSFIFILPLNTLLMGSRMMQKFILCIETKIIQMNYLLLEYCWTLTLHIGELQASSLTTSNSKNGKLGLKTKRRKILKLTLRNL